jgi:glyoxalase family protein
VQLNGIHHISAITGDARRNAEFYAGTLGLRLVAKTVNQDDPGAYHLFYADEHGSAGGDITFFEYPGATRGRPGAGSVHRIVWRVPSPDALGFWEQRLQGVAERVERHGDELRFDDPEGLGHALVAYEGPDVLLRAHHPDIPAEYALAGFDGVRAWTGAPDVTAQVLERLMGATARADGSWELRGGSRSGWIDVSAHPAGDWVRQGAGVVHHVAFATNHDDEPEWNRLIGAAGIATSGLVDRHYFQSVYFREPGGLLFELATDGPGFTVDGPEEELGTRIILPPWLEHRRAEVEARLTPIPDPRAAWGDRPATGAPA